MSRIFILGAVLAVLAGGCTGSVTSETAAPTVVPTVAAAAAVPETAAVPTDAADEPAQVESEPSLARLLPDPARWVVVDDWIERAGTGEFDSGTDHIQLDVAPLEDDGVPQLGERISLVYRPGSADDLERYWGDASSMGEAVDFEISDGIGRSVSNADGGFSMALVLSGETIVTIQAHHGAVDLTELAKTLELVDEAAWDAARAGAEGQRLVAVEAAMTNVEVDLDLDEPLPHWVFPEPWELKWVTDMTIWTPEQKAQAAAFSEANRPANLAAGQPANQAHWRFAVAESAEAASTQFVPDATISVGVFDDPPDPMFPTNYPTISAFGLEGVISPIAGSGTHVELGTANVRVFVTTSRMPPDQVREFLAKMEFASDDPLDGFIASDPGIQPLDLVELTDRPPSWHAAWQQPGELDATISVRRLSVPELRVWIPGRGSAFDVPDDVWETIASEGVIDFGLGATYDVSTGLLIMLRGVDQSDLISIALDDWIALVEPVNADPLRPR